jgi:hypothetical protein
MKGLAWLEARSGRPVTAAPCASTSWRSQIRRGLRVHSVTVPATAAMPSRAQREPAPVDGIATCRAPSTGTVNEAHRHEEKARFPHSTARGLAARRRTSRKGRRLDCGGGRDPWRERGVDLLRPMWRLLWREGETASSL